MKIKLFNILFPKVFKQENDTRNLTKVKWGKEACTWEIGRGIHWTEHLAVQERINKKASGSTQIDPYQFFMDFLNKRGINFPLERCLTLGCGGGDLERGFSKYHFCLRHDAFDIADEAIKKAKEKAESQGLTHIFYDVKDINEVVLLPNTYDVIFGVSSVHHFKNLEHIYFEVRKALKPGGFFFLNEFVGPTKFQWTDKQLNIVNNLHLKIPIEN